ncbi:TPA: DNA-binding protein [Klebsiella pneumoniae]|uniref:DNA-binding protein n=1 Tax=Klebsiella TaxID=570 RepID=UPI000E2D86B1|nr:MULTISPECIES: DNA-binding protein [Klebsiella]HCZ9102426.1 DNA-binding protein [Klebsiella michiganensis]AXS16847.1 DNA-binding protein [Klebsiella pneumoniae]MBK4948543.1 DNA-binding protein [Klebsiella pneumoniae]MBL0835474.1 DNA-binding protein [Klebsiella pneumoniae]MCE0172555.1 DNA-binding protein [Klebsiella pneumoniae]
MKVTEPRLNTLIDNLNTLICEDSLLTRPERETLVLAVAAIGAMKARVSMKKGEAPAAAKPEKSKRKEIIPDPRFPNARQAWVSEEETLLLDALDGVPNDEIGKHLFWLSEKLGRTPFSVACKIASQRHLRNDWKEQFREISDKIRLSGLSISDYLKQSGTDRND